MRLGCPICKAEYNIDERRLPPRGANVRCPKCKGVFPVVPPAPAGGGLSPPFAKPFERVPLPPPPRTDSARIPAAPVEPPPPRVAPPVPVVPPSVPAPAAAPPVVARAPEPPAPPPSPVFPTPDPFASAPDPFAPARTPFAEPSAPSAPAAASAAPPLAPPPTVETELPPAPWEDIADDVAPPPPVTAPKNVVAPAHRQELQGSVAPKPPALDFGEIDFGDDSAFGDDAPAIGAASAAASSEIGAAPAAPAPIVSGPAAPPAPPATAALLGNEEPFPFDVGDDVPLGAPAASADRPADGVGAPTGAAQPEPFAPAAATSPEVPAVGHSAEDPRPATEIAAMLPEPVAPDATASTQQVAADDELEALFAKTRAAPEANEERRGAAAVPALDRELPRTITATAPRLPGRATAPAGRGGTGRRWVWLALAAAVVVVLGAGVAAGFVTPYGFFLHRLVRGQTGAQRPGAKLLADARVRLAEDRFTSIKAAIEQADRALRLQSSDVEAKAVYAYSVSLLARRHGGAPAAWTRARGFLQELSRYEANDPDAAKALVGAALVAGARPPAAAVATLEREIARTGTRDGDALLVLGDAALAGGDAAKAATYYGRLAALQPGTARAAHALGVAAARRGDVAGAEKQLKAALAADPRHLVSLLQLGKLALAAGDRDRAEADARALLAPDAQSETGPRDRARARMLLGLLSARSVDQHVQASLAAGERELEAAMAEDPDDVEPRIALATFQLDRGAVEKASATLAPAVLAAPHDPRVASANALVLSAQGRGPQGIAALDAALEAHPGDARLLQTKGVLAAAAGKQGDADRFWNEAAAHDPAAFEPHLSIAQARFLRGDLEGAEKELKLAAERAPASGEVLSAAADLRLARRDVEGAEEGYRRALSVDGACGAAHLGLARVALERGEADDARAELRRAVTIAPRLAAAQALQGELLWRARDLPAARRALEAAVALDPQDAMSTARLGAVELLQGDRDAAVTHLKAASAAVVGSAEVRAWYGRALLARGELQPGIEQLRKSIELDPRDALVHLQLGQALERIASIPEAAEAYRAAQARAPKMMEAYEALGLLFSTQNRCGDALPQLEKASVLAPREPRLRIEVADCKARLGRHAEAAAIYRRVLEADPKQVTLPYKIARAEQEAHGVRQALPWYERAAREEPGNPLPHYYLGFAYKERGQAAKAIAEFRAYLAASPAAEDRRDIEREIEDLGGAPQAAAPRR